MIKFDNGAVTKYFETAEDAAKWLVDEWDNDGEFAYLLENEFYTFGYWLNDHYTAIDILTIGYTYNELYEDYFEGLVYDVGHDYVTYFKRVEDKE